MWQGADRQMEDDDQGGTEGGSIHCGDVGRSGQVEMTQSSAMPNAQGGVNGSRNLDGNGFRVRIVGDRALGGGAHHADGSLRQ